MPDYEDRGRTWGCRGETARARPRGDARCRLSHRRRSARLARRRDAAADQARDARRARAATRRPATGGRRAVRRDPRGALPRCDPVREPLRPPPLLRVRPVRRHVARRARRLHRERLQPLRRLVDGVRRPDAARARAPLVVQGLDRLPGGGRRLARHRRLGREPDGARLRARGTPPVAKRRPRRLRLRPGALVDRTQCAHPRLRPRAGARAPGGRRPAARAGDARRRDRGRRIRGQGAVLRRRERRRDELRRGRPADGDRRALPGQGSLAAHRCGVRRLRGAHRARAPRTRRDRARRLDHARPTQVALPAVRMWLPARTRRPRVEKRVRDQLGLPPRRRAGRRRGELRRRRAAAEPLVAGVQALALPPHLRARRLPRRDRRVPRPGRARPALHRGERAARAGRATVARHALLPAAAAGRRGRGVARPWARRGAGRERARLHLLDARARPVRVAALHPQPHEHGPGRRAGARLSRVCRAPPGRRTDRTGSRRRRDRAAVRPAHARRGVARRLARDGARGARRRRDRRALGDES